MKYQTSWLKHFYPHDEFSNKHSSWFYLQKYMLPFIQRYASSYHVKGIHRLKLNENQPPDFAFFQDLFYKTSDGFEIFPVTHEIAPIEYFSLISQKKFPCIKVVRSLQELFCSNEPDFWHESIGHIAPLCFREVQDFYLEISDYMLSAKSASQFQTYLEIAWTLTEYGFIKEQNQNKMFGAALVGSHLANMRYQNDLINVEAADKDNIINSRFYSEEAPLPRGSDGKLRFFCLKSFRISHLFG